MNDHSDAGHGPDGPPVWEMPLTLPEPMVTWAGPCAGTVGQELEYALEVSNPSDSDFGVLVSASLPAGLVLLAADGAAYDPAARRIDWELPALAANQSRRLCVRLLAQTAAPMRLNAEARSTGGFTAKADWPVVIEAGRDDPASLDKLLAEAEKDLNGPTPARKPESRSFRPLATDEEGERHLLISLAGKEYALPASGVVEVSQPLRVSRVPNVPDWVLGLTNVRGDVVSVVDLRAFLGLGSGESTGQARMVVVRSLSGDLTTIFLVDRVRSIRRLFLDNSGHAITDPRLAEYVRGMREYNGGLLIVLDLERLLESADLRELEPT